MDEQLQAIKQAQEKHLRAIEQAQQANNAAINSILTKEVGKEDIKKLQRYQAEFNLLIAEAKQGKDIQSKVKALMKKYK